MRRIPKAVPENHSLTRARVLYADTDRMGVVYHATYMRWFEAARGDFMRVRGATYLELEEQGVQLPVVEAHLSYFQPALYDDVIEIASWIGEVGRAQVRFEYSIFRGGEVLVQGFTQHAAVGPGRGLMRLPPALKDALLKEVSVDPKASSPVL